MRRNWPGAFLLTTPRGDSTTSTGEGIEKGPAILPAATSCASLEVTNWWCSSAEGWLIGKLLCGLQEIDDGIRKPKVNPLIKRVLLTLSYPTRYVASLWGRIGVGRFVGGFVGGEACFFPWPFLPQ